MKKAIIMLAVALCSTTLLQSSASAQGLAERRAAAEYQAGKFKELETEIQAAAGFPVPVKVDWSKLSLAGESENYKQDGFWTNIYFVPLIAALKGVTQDDMGKTALKENLKEIQITYDEATAPASNYANGLAFESGMLKINFKPWSNADDINQRKEAIQKALEDKL